MSTGYTQAQLNALWEELEAAVPPLPSPADKSDAPRVAAMRCSGTELGVVFNLGFKSGKSLMFFNCCVAKEFAAAINAAGQAYGWQKRGLVPAPSEHLATPNPEDLPTAINVASLSTYAMPAGMLAKLYMPQYGDAGATLVFFFPRPAAMEFATYIFRAGELAQWWDSEFELIPLGN